MSVSQDFSRTYAPPGVYISEDESLVVTSGGVPPTLVALVGPTRGYMVATEQVALGADSVVLSNRGINVDSAVVTVAETGAVIEPTDYTLTPTTPPVGGSKQDYTVSLSDTSNNELEDGTPVFVTYHYTPVDYYEPKFVETFEDVKEFYGEPLNLAPGSSADPDYQHVLSPLSLAAKVAMENGATELILCAAEPPAADANTPEARSAARRSALAKALARTETYSAINVIVAVASGIVDADAPGTLLDLNTHIQRCYNENVPRTGVIGFDPAVSTPPDQLLATSGVKNRRLMLAYAGPGALLMYSGGVNSTFSASHAYLAAAMAGRMASLPVQRSLTKQTLSSFFGLGGTPLSNSLKNRYSRSGVAVVEVNRLGALVVRHGVTTDPTNINTREASVVRARDALVTMVANGFADTDIIGQPVDGDTLYTVKSIMQGFLETAVGADTIVSYDGLQVRQRPAEPDVVEIRFAYKPAYPLNYVMVSFSIDMTTGSTAELSTDATG